MNSAGVARKFKYSKKAYDENRLGLKKSALIWDLTFLTLLEI